MTDDTPGAMLPGAGGGGGDRALTGVLGLDDVLAGGLPRDRLHLVEGTPGTGKTTLALQLLLEGRRLGERGIFEAAHREARQGRDPRTGEAVQVAASTTVKFTPAEGLKDARDGGGG
jgi:RecA/RadA recombinase